MMSTWFPESWLLLWPPLAICLAAVCHVLVVRLSRRRTEWGHLFIGVLIGGVLLWGAMVGEIVSGQAPSDIVAIVVLNTLSYLGLAFLYADFNNMSLTSVRIRVLRECCESRCGLTMEQLLERYDVTSLVKKRLDKYVRQRFLVREAETYRIGNPTIVWVCRFYQLLHRIMFGLPMTVAPKPDEAVDKRTH